MYATLGALALALLSPQDLRVVDTQSHHDQKLGITVLRGFVEVPVGLWGGAEGEGLADLILGMNPAPGGPGVREPGQPGDPEIPRVPETMELTLRARLVPELASSEIRVSLTELGSDRRLEVLWPIAQAEEGDGTLLKEWAQQRADQWRDQDPELVSPIHRLWRLRFHELYGVEIPPGRRVRDGNQVPGLFTLLGGQPAMRETLQMEAIGALDAEHDQSPELPIESVSSLEVASHPFEEMLQGRQPVAVPLADFVPPESAFVHLRRPRGLGSFLGKGAPSMARFATIATGNGLDYGLEQRYCRAMGLEPEFVRGLVESGAIEECALFLPDLFFVDGTDLTVIARLNAGPALDALRALSGLGGSGGAASSAPTEVPTRAGGSAWWAQRGDLIFVSTSKGDLLTSLLLHDGEGRGSLGQSAEFRFMTSCVPMLDSTVGQVYLSDAFLRRLTGPELKIGQLRRSRERVAMESIVAAEMLRRADGHQPESWASLADRGYLKASLLERDWERERSGRPRSPRWGALDAMAPLSANPVTAVSAVERDLYKTYVDRYQSYWRRFYDPIALRYDDLGQGEHSLTTFVLPLLDNSVYNELRQILPPSAPDEALRVPRFEPAPVLCASAQLPPMGWAMLAEGLSDVTREAGSIDRRIWGLLGPQVHLAVQDDRPLLRMGSGELMGLMGGGSGVFGSGLDEMVWVPVIATLLTRPCDVALEVSDPELARNILRGVRVKNQRDDWFAVNSYQLGDGRRIFSLVLLDLFKWDFSVEVQDRWLVLSNHPWDGPAKITGHDEGRLGGASIQIDLDVLHDGRESSFASFAEADRKVRFNGMARLLPWLWSGAEDPRQAAAWSGEWVGRRPLIPSDGDLRWDHGLLSSQAYGERRQPRQPASPPEGFFGLLDQVRDLEVEVQIEEDGLRSVLHWTTRHPQDGPGEH